MAGIGFVLRKLSRQDNLIGIVQAYTHSALASTGPWLFTVLALGAIMVVSGNYTTRTELYDFRILVIYNFGFSLVMSGPVTMIATRFLADSIHNEDVSSAPGMLIGTLIFLYATQIPLVSAVYIFYAELSDTLALSTIVNFMLITTIWMLAVFLTALKDYKTITRAFGMGCVITVIASAALAEEYAASGIMNGFNIGLAYIVAVLTARIFAEYPYPLQRPFAFLSYFRKYWEIALGGLIYNMAAWVDKWIMWFAPEAEKTRSNLLLYPDYDSAMFLAYLTIVPAMAFFVFSIETSFYERYLNFYRDIQKNATFRKIQQNHSEIIRSITGNIRNFLILQGSICVTVILLSPRIFEAMNINYMQIGMFRYGVVGAFFHLLVMLLSILLSYFDNRRAALAIQITFLLTNAGFTLVFMQLGHSYYGFGYLMASVVTFVSAAFITFTYVRELPYHTFITSNSSVNVGR